VINLAIAACLLFSYTAVYIKPSFFLIPAFFGLAYPYIVFVNILFALFWLVFNAKYSLISILAMLVGVNFLGSYFQVNGESTQKKCINICSYNVKYFAGEKTIPQRATLENIIEFLNEGSFDIICLQEANISGRGLTDMQQVKSSLTNINYMQTARTSRTGGSVTFTKYPIVGTGEIRYENSGNMILYTDLLIARDTIRIYNGHLQSYRIKAHEINSLDSLNLGNQKNYNEVKSVGSKLKQAFVKRSEQAIKLRIHMDESPYPIIVCGDFNDTPVSYSYHKVKGGLKDAFVESGQGIGNTYNGKLPSFRIDYILHDRIFESFDFKVGKQTFSDHFPVICKLSITKGNKTEKR